MAKPEWGVKRVCQSCAIKFYDLGRSPIACPRCGAAFDPEALLKSRRSRPAVAPKPVPEPIKTKPKVEPEAEAEDIDIKLETDDDVELDGDDEDDSVLVDASDLGEDDITVVVADDEKEDT